MCGEINTICIVVVVILALLYATHEGFSDKPGKINVVSGDESAPFSQKDYQLQLSNTRNNLIAASRLIPWNDNQYCSSVMQYATHANKDFSEFIIANGCGKKYGGVPHQYNSDFMTYDSPAENEKKLLEKQLINLRDLSQDDYDDDNTELSRKKLIQDQVSKLYDNIGYVANLDTFKTPINMTSTNRLMSFLSGELINEMKILNMTEIKPQTLQKLPADLGSWRNARTSHEIDNPMQGMTTKPNFAL
jgi:hypothetical protein